MSTLIIFYAFWNFQRSIHYKKNILCCGIANRICNRCLFWEPSQNQKLDTVLPQTLLLSMQSFESYCCVAILFMSREINVVLNYKLLLILYSCFTVGRTTGCARTQKGFCTGRTACSVVAVVVVLTVGGALLGVYLQNRYSTPRCIDWGPGCLNEGPPRPYVSVNNCFCHCQ